VGHGRVEGLHVRFLRDDDVGVAGARLTRAEDDAQEGDAENEPEEDERAAGDHDGGLSGFTDPRSGGGERARGGWGGRPWGGRARGGLLAMPRRSGRVAGPGRPTPGGGPGRGTPSGVEGGKPAHVRSMRSRPMAGAMRRALSST